MIFRSKKTQEKILHRGVESIQNLQQQKKKQDYISIFFVLISSEDKSLKNLLVGLFLTFQKKLVNVFQRC